MKDETIMDWAVFPSIMLTKKNKHKWIRVTGYITGMVLFLILGVLTIPVGIYIMAKDTYKTI